MDFFPSGVSLKYIFMFVGRIKLQVQILPFVSEIKQQDGILLGSMSFHFQTWRKWPQFSDPARLSLLPWTTSAPFILSLLLGRDDGTQPIWALLPQTMTKVNPLGEWLSLLPQLIPWILLKDFLLGLRITDTDIRVFLSIILWSGRDLTCIKDRASASPVLKLN